MQDIPLTEARARLGELVDQVRFGGEPIMLTRSGKPAAALVPFRVYEEWKAERDKQFQVLDDIWALNLGQDMTEDEAMEWSVEIANRVRREMSAERTAAAADSERDNQEPVIAGV